MEKLNKAAAVAGGAVILFTGALLAYGQSRKGQQSPSDVTHAQNTSDQNVNANNGFTPSAPSPFDFSWVDGNDRAGSQTIQFGVELIDTGAINNNVTDIDWVQGQSHTFKVYGALWDTKSYASLSRWGYAWTLFDADNRNIKAGSGVTDSSGQFSFNVAFAPEKAGVYRMRVSAGDAADEQPIVFNLPASQTLHGLFGD